MRLYEDFSLTTTFKIFISFLPLTFIYLSRCVRRDCVLRRSEGVLCSSVCVVVEEDAGDDCEDAGTDAKAR